MWSRRSDSAAEPRTGGCPLGIALAAGFATAAGACVVASLAVPANQTTVRLIVVCVCLAGYAAAVPNVLGALLTAVVAWSMYVGFIVERAGELRWHGGVDLVRLGMLMMAVLAGSAWRLMTRPRSDPAESPWAARPWAEPPATSSRVGDHVRVPTQHSADRRHRNNNSCRERTRQGDQEIRRHV